MATGGPLAAQTLPPTSAPAAPGTVTTAERPAPAGGVAHLFNKSPLTAEDLAAIDRYTKAWVDYLLGSTTPADVTRAREALLQPARQQFATPLFREAYATSAADALVPAFDTKSDLVRLNALVAARELKTGRLAAPLLKYLDSTRHGERYSAAAAVAEIGRVPPVETSPFTPTQQVQLVNKLLEVIARENEESVLAQQLLALGVLTIPEAKSAVVKVLTDRVNAHVGGIRPSFRAEVQMLRAMPVALILERTDDRTGVTPDRLRGITIVQAKYLLLVATHLQKNLCPDDLKPHAAQVPPAAQEVFRMALTQFDPGFPPGQDVKGPTERMEWDVLLLNTYDWVGNPGSPGVLSKSKIAIPQEQLTLPEPSSAAVESTDRSGP